MKLSKNANYLLILGFLVILNVLFRFPTTPHELGSDSFVMHGMTNFISENGYAKWIIHPLSFFGFYPLSYPSGGIFYLSGISQSTWLDIEYSILITSIIFGVLGAFTMYLMAKEIFHDDFFPFAAAFIFSTSNVFLAYTTWTYTTRGLFVVLLPLFIWSLLKIISSKKKEGYKFIIMAGLLLLMLGAVHHMVIFIPLILIAYFIAIFFHRYKHKFEDRLIIKRAPFLFLAIFIALFLMQFMGFTIYNPSYDEFQKGSIFQGSEFIVILVNMGIRYAMSIGILVILIPIGVVSLVFKPHKELPEIFLLVLVLCFTPFLMDSKYIPTFLLPIFSVFISISLLEISKAINKMKRMDIVTISVLMIILLFSAFLPSFVEIGGAEHLPGYTVYMKESTYDLGLFIKDYGNSSSILSNDNSIESRIKATSGALTFENPDKYDLSTIQRVPLSEVLSKNKDAIYTIQDPYFNRNYYSGLHKWQVMNKNWDNNLTRKIISDDNIHYVVLNNYYPTKWSNINTEEFEDSPFIISVQMDKNRIYDNNLESIWYLSI